MSALGAPSAPSALSALSALSAPSARVISLDRGYPLVKTKTGEWRAQHSIELVKNSELRSVVGDLVDLEFPPGQDTPLIQRIHPRGHTLRRRSLVQSRSVGAGKYDEQILATNIGIVFVVSALSGQRLDLSYLERQLVMAYDSGAAVAVVLSKADHAKHLQADVRSVAEVCAGAELIVECAHSGEGVARVAELCHQHDFAVLLGRSGVGKSSLINAMLGETAQLTGAVRSKDRAGRHVTVGRKMLFLPDGGAVIDSPGLRSLGLYGAEFGLSRAFADVVALAADCRYRDCSHSGEPECAVQTAVRAGELSERRLASYIDIANEVCD